MLFKSNLFLSIFRQNKSSLSLIYALNVAQETCYLLIPAAVGMLINTFIEGKSFGLLAFSSAYIGWQGITTLRKVLDTKAFTRIFNQVSLKMIEHHKQENIEISVINARIELLKQVVNFFEIDLPFLVSSMVMMIGSAALLYFYNPVLMLVCLLIILPSLTINYFFGKKMIDVTEKVNDQYEKQIEIIEKSSIEDIKTYFAQVRLLNIKKSNLEAYNFGILEFFVFLMIVVSIYVICKTPNISYGDIVATYGYILRFAYSFDFIPHITARFASLKDIEGRLEEVYG